MSVASPAQGLVKHGQRVAGSAAPGQNAQQVGDHTIERQDLQAVDIRGVLGNESAVVCDEPFATCDGAAVGHHDVRDG